MAVSAQFDLAHFEAVQKACAPPILEIGRERYRWEIPIDFRREADFCHSNK
jgi:hypothetical protein